MALNNFRDIFSESRNIFKANSSPFQTLVLIFLFPFSFLLSLNLSNIFSKFSYTNLQHQIPNHTFLLYSLLALLFSNCGVISITYSVFNNFYGQPVNLQSAINSISSFFLPLLATTIVSQVIIFCISLLYALLLVLAIYGVVLFDITISYSSPYFIAFFVVLPLLLVLIYLQVNWALVPVIVVVESCWGLEPLRRSARLIKGMKGVVLSSLFVYGFFGGITVWNGLSMITGSNGTTYNWVYWASILSQSCFLALFMLSYIAVNTILYIYCKTNHGELVEEFRKDGVSLRSLPFHHGKASTAV